MSNWTTENIADLTGQIIIVTGANSGLGYESTLALAAKGAEVIMACRNIDKAQSAASIIEDKVPGAKLKLMALDLSSLASVRAFAAAFKAEYKQLNVLMNNAGVMAIPRKLTEDGFEMQFGINHLAHFALTGLLLDMLNATPGSRVVNVSSDAHRFGTMNFDDLMLETVYSRWSSYGQSKLSNLLFTFELQRKLETAGSVVTAYAAHPGYAATNLQSNDQPVMNFIMSILGRFMAQSAAMGALPQLYAAVESEAKAGAYYGPDRGMKGYPTEVKAKQEAYDLEDAKQLWTASEELTGVTFKF